MAKHKKIISIIEGNSEQITTEETVIAPLEVPVEVAIAKPLFTEDKSDVYRQLLLGRPGVPTITNIREAVAFVEAYGKWNNKVRIAFK